MPLTPEQIQQARSGAGFSPTPNAPVSVSLSERLGLTNQKGVAGFNETVRNTISSSLGEAKESLQKSMAGEMNPFAAGANIFKNVTGAAVAPIVNLPGIKQVGEGFSKVGQAVVDSPIGEKVTDVISENVPYEVVGGVTDTLEGGLNTLTLAGGVRGGKTLLEKAPSVLEKGKNVVRGAKEKLTSTPEAKIAKEINDLVDATSGVADKNARISALEQTGAVDKSGKPVGGTKQTLTGGIEIAPDSRAVARAKSVQGVVKPKASPVENLTRLNKEISRVSEQEVAPNLKKAGSVNPISEKAPGWSKITQRLTDIEKPDIIKADATLDKTYDLVRGRMLEQIQKQPPTVEGLWEARKAFDQVVKDQFGDVAFNSEKNTAIKRAISDMRREVNNIIGERAPQYKAQMDRLGDMYDARYNIAEQYQNLVDKGGWKAFKALNPKKAALLQWGGTITGLGIGKELLMP